MWPLSSQMDAPCLLFTCQFILAVYLYTLFGRKSIAFIGRTKKYISDV